MRKKLIAGVAQDRESLKSNIKWKFSMCLNICFAYFRILVELDFPSK